MAVVEVPQTLEYRGGQLNAAPVLEVENFTNWKKRFMCHIIDERKAANLDQRLKSLIMHVLPDDQINSVINCLTAKSIWDDLILYHEGPSDVKESRVMDLKLCYNTFKFKKGESLTQTFTIYKALMTELVNDGIKLSKLEINIGFINGLPKKCLSFCKSLRNTNHVKDSELASLFDFQDSPGDEEDTRSSQEYLNDLEKEYQARALLAKSKRFFKKCTQRFSSTKATDQTECHKCSKKGHFARDYWPTKDFEAKYNKVKAKLALLSSSASASKAPMVKNKGLIAEAYEWDEEEVSSDDNEMVEVKLLMALAEENDPVSKESAKNGEWVKISMRKVHTLLETENNDDRKHVNTEILKENKNLRSELKELKAITETWLNTKGFILPNHDTGRILPAKSQRNTTDPSVAVTDSSVTDYDSADESLVCSTLLPPLKKLEGAEPIFEPKTIKSVLKSKSTLKAEALKGVIINEPSSAPAKDNKGSSTSKVHSAPAGKLKSVKIKDDPPLAIVMKELNSLKLQVSKNQSSYPRNNQSQQVEFLFEEIAFTTNNEVALLYPSHPNQEYLSEFWYTAKVLPDTKIWVSTPTREVRGEICITTFRNSLRAQYIPHSSMYVSLPSITTVRPWFTTIGYNREIRTKGTLNKSCLPPRWRLMMGQIIQYLGGKTGSLDQISNKDATILYCLENGVQVDYAKIIWKDLIHKLNKKTRVNSVMVNSIVQLIERKKEQSSTLQGICYDCSSIYIHNHKDHLRKFNEKANVGYLLGYSLVSKAFRVFNTRRQQIEETYHFTFNESPEAIKFSKPSVDNINIAETERYPLDEYIHPYEPSQSNPGARMLTRAMAKQLSAASAHECLFVDFLSKEESKKVSEALKHPGWVDAIQDELNQFARNKV
ncbi:hypothetical protein Tco_0117474 [Tanacetum coccineum]